MKTTRYVKTVRAGDYFRKLHETVKNSKQPVAIWDGELYLEFHRGTYTSQSYSKKMNRRMEELYRKAELLSVMNALAKGSLVYAEQETLTEGWKIILTHQFHDILPGSSIHEVYYYGKTNLLKSSCSKIIFNMIKQNNRLKSIPECFEDIIYLEKL